MGTRIKTGKLVTITDAEAVRFLQEQQAKRGDRWPAQTATKIILERKRDEEQRREHQPPEAA